MHARARIEPGYRPWRCGALVLLALLLGPARPAGARDVAAEPGSVCRVGRAARLRPQPRARSRGKRLRAGARVHVVSATGAWLRVRTANGREGFVRRGQVSRCRPPGGGGSRVEAESAAQSPARAGPAVPPGEAVAAPATAPASGPTDVEASTASAPWTEGAAPGFDTAPTSNDKRGAASSAYPRERATGRRRAAGFQLEARYRRLFVPGPLLEIFFSQYQPVSGHAVSAAFNHLSKSGLVLGLSLSYGSLRAPDGPWEDRDEDGSDPDWSIVDLSFVSAAATVGYELKLVGPFSVLMGTGLGVAKAWGKMLSYNDPSGPNGAPKPRSYPPLLPIVHVQFSPRIVLERRFVIQLDAGVATGLYLGASAGMRW